MDFFRFFFFFYFCHFFRFPFFPFCALFPPSCRRHRRLHEELYRFFLPPFRTSSEPWIYAKKRNHTECAHKHAEKIRSHSVGGGKILPTSRKKNGKGDRAMTRRTKQNTQHEWKIQNEKKKSKLRNEKRKKRRQMRGRRNNWNVRAPGCRSDMTMVMLFFVVVVVVGVAIRARRLAVPETRSRHSQVPCAITKIATECCAHFAVEHIEIYEMNDSVGLIQSSAHNEMEWKRTEGKNRICEKKFLASSLARWSSRVPGSFGRSVVHSFTPTHTTCHVHI